MEFVAEKTVNGFLRKLLANPGNGAGDSRGAIPFQDMEFTPTDGSGSMYPS